MTTRALTALALLALTGFASAQTPPGPQQYPYELEFGYRFTDVSGNEDLYRSQVNERDGFLLRSFSIFTTDFDGATAAATDQVRISGSNLGAGPAGALRVDAGLMNSYRLRVLYRSFDSYSALPGFANPFLQRGVPSPDGVLIPGQHTYDRDRMFFDADVEIMPGRWWFTPFVGFSTMRNDGPGTTTYFLGQDEFLLGSDISERENEFRAGLSFSRGAFAGQITQGWRRLTGDESFTLRSTRGNNLSPILGRDVVAQSVTREGEIDVDAPYTNAFVTADLIPRVRLIGEFINFDADTDGSELEESAGSFVSFEISRFFAGLTENIDSRANQSAWRGGLRAEAALTDRIGLLVGYERESREQTGFATISSLFRNSVTFGGGDLRDLQTLLSPQNRFERTEDTVSAELHARTLAGLALRVGVRSASQDYSMNPDAAEIVLPMNQGGDFDRRVNTIDATAAFTRGLVSVSGSIRRDDADDIVMRTDFTTRDRYRLRAGIRTLNNTLHAGVQAEQMNAENDVPEVAYDSEARQYSADVEYAPLTMLRLRAAYTQHNIESRATFLRPESFQPEVSFQEEDGDSIEGGVGLLWRALTLDASLSRYENDGTIPFSFDRYRIRAAYDFLANYGIAAEWAHDSYDEAPIVGEYEADRIGIFLRYRR